MALLVNLAQLSALFTNAPLAAAGAAAVSIPIAIHLLTRLRRRPQRWAAMRFLVQAFRQHRHRMRIEQIVLLLVRCLIVLLVGLALSGPLWGGVLKWARLDASGRLICLVIDDSLSTQAVDAKGIARFEAIRAEALAIVRDLRPGDRVGVWRGARPNQILVAPGAPGSVAALDRAAIRQAIESIKPRYSRSSLPAALDSVATVVAEHSLPPGRAFVVLISDFAQDAFDLGRSPPPAIVTLGKQAHMLISRPAPLNPNVQIAALRPRRHMVLADPSGSTTISLELYLRRFATDAASVLTAVRVTMLDPQGASSRTAVSVTYRWSAGQSSAVINIELPVGESDGLLEAGRVVPIHARLDPGGWPDALAADNDRWTVVDLRYRLRVGVVDEPAPELDSDQGPVFSPGQWIKFALAPWGSNAGRGEATSSADAIQLIDLTASELAGDQVALLDAVVVLRPDLLTDDGFEALEQVVDDGGLVWVFTPPTLAPHAWAPELMERLGLDWRIGIEPKIAGSADTPLAEGADSSESAWRLALDHSIPEPLELLSADWEALLRPIRVRRRLSAAAVGDSDAVWLGLAGTDDGALLLAARRSQGTVLLFATALDPSWMNIQTKPLFVPLVHETLRGVLGSARQDQALSDLICGDQPVFDRRWRNVRQIAHVGGTYAVTLRQDDTAAVATAPIERPGVYVSQPADSGTTLAVNVEADGGDTRALDDKALGAWLSSAGGTWDWIDPDRPAKALEARTARSNIGWLLLWPALALVLLEAVLARWLSHAVVHDGAIGDQVGLAKHTTRGTIT